MYTGSFLYLKAVGNLYSQVMISIVFILIAETLYFYIFIVN